MMRALYSGISGLKVHQSKMDVIGNNISNVNTVGFKASQVTFSDILYQTTSAATGPNSENGRAGVNAKQIGLGANFASVKTTMDSTGGSQRTDNPLDLMIEGDGFFIVGNGNQKLFTKAGSFTVDAEGTLCTATGYPVLGWGTEVDSKTEELRIKVDTVAPLHVMSSENLFSEPEITKNVHFTGNIDSSDSALVGSGRATNFTFYDKLGKSYTVQMRVTQNVASTPGSQTAVPAEYVFEMTDVLDADGKSIFTVYDPAQKKYVRNTNITDINFGGYNYRLEDNPTTAGDPVRFNEETGRLEANGLTISKGSGGSAIAATDPRGPVLKFDAMKGRVEYISPDGAAVNAGDEVKNLEFYFNIIPQATGGTDPVQNPYPTKLSGSDDSIDVDFSQLTMFANSGKTTLEGNKGSVDNLGKGRTMGKMSGITVDNAGILYGVYDNGVSKILGQVVIAKFPNNSGLEAVGNNLFAETQNSGEFDGIGEDITASGGKFNVGVLESSNVDLSSEFTEMITTQRGFQANSRIITVSDTLLEELVNLKR